MKVKKIVLAYSGGLDTSVAIPWLKENYQAEIVTVTVDLGMTPLEAIRQRALAIGADQALVIDGKEDFVKHFVYPSLQAGAIYENYYPLATALGRPLIARCLINIAHDEKADAIAHGCTGKGNDQVRFHLAVAALDPKLHVLAPIREWEMNREQELLYAQERGIPIQPKKSIYSIDENLWGRSIEAGPLEDPWAEPPEDAFAWTNSMPDTPEKPSYVEIGFHMGLPSTIDDTAMSGLDLITYLNKLGGEHGVGRIDQVENRVTGIKSREIYENPAATILHVSHLALEAMTLSKHQMRLKARVSEEYADVVYNGLWYTQHRDNLDAYVQSTQLFVTGKVRLRLHKGSCAIVGRQAEKSLYQHRLATYDKSDEFDHSASEGFIQIYGLPVQIQAQAQNNTESNASI